jgi:hypothetical protein
MKVSRSWVTLAVTLLVAVSLPAVVAQAAEGGHLGRGHFGGGWHGGFDGHPGEHWGGHWPDHHWDGRWGWGGVDDGGWYFYPSPIYPYPDPDVPPTAVASSAGYRYYCASAGAYYPYVTQCTEAWQPVLPQAPAL